jgi:GNAT superfamily N-acetyltransferase
MDDIIYRKIKKSDYEKIKKMVDETWHITDCLDHKKVGKIFLNMFINSLLMIENYTQVAVENEKVLGVIVGKTKRKNFNLKKILYFINLIIDSIKINFIIKTDKDKNVVKDYMELISTYKKLKNEINRKFDGQIELLAVDEKSRGKRIGKTLVNNFFEHCKENNVKNIYLYTDTKCNYKFYDIIGMTQLGEKTGNFKSDLFGDEDFKVFMYSIDF